MIEGMQNQLNLYEKKTTPIIANFFCNRLFE